MTELQAGGKARTKVGMVTFIDRTKTKWKKDPGFCYLMAGFVPDGETEGGLTAVRLTPDAMPDPSPAIGAAQTLGLTP